MDFELTPVIRRRIIIGVIGFFVLLNVVWFMLSFRLYIFNLSQPSARATAIHIDEQTNIFHIGSLYFVPTGTTYVEFATAGTTPMVTQYRLDKDDLLTLLHPATITFTRQFDISRIANDVEDCFFEDTAIYTFSCTSPKDLYQISGFNREKAFDLPQLRGTISLEESDDNPQLTSPDNDEGVDFTMLTYASYKDGLLYLSETNKGEVVLKSLSDNGTAKTIAKLDISSDLDRDALTIVISPDSKSILIVNATTGKVLYLPTISDKTVQLADAHDTASDQGDRNTSCSLNKQIACYTGVPSTYLQGDVDEDAESYNETEAMNRLQDGQITTYDLSGQQTATYTVPKTTAIDTICTDSNNHLYGTDFDGSFMIHTKDSQAIPEAILDGNQTIYCAEDAYYTQSNGLYKVEDDRTSVLVYGADSMEKFNGTVVNGKIYFVAAPKDSGILRNLYALEGEVAPDAKRVEDILAAVKSNRDMPFFLALHKGNGVKLRIFEETRNVEEVKQTLTAALRDAGLPETSAIEFDVSEY